MILVGTSLSVYRRPPHRKRDDDLDPRRLQSLLDATVGNPWQRLTEMNVHNQPWVPYTDRDALAALQHVTAHQSKELVGQVDLRGPGDEPVEGRISTYSGMYAMVYAPDRFVTDQNQARALAKQLIALMPENATAVVATEELSDFHLAQLPRPFEYWPWLTGLTAEACKPYFSRDVLLATPAVSVEEDAEGRIWIQFYDNLLDSESPGAKAKMAEVHAYLHAHAQEQWLPF